MSRLILALLLAVGLGLGAAGCGGSSPESGAMGASKIKKAATPEECMKIVQQAAEAGNWGQVYDCLTEKAQKRMSLAVIFVLEPVRKSGPEGKAKVEALMEAHGQGKEAGKNRKRSTDMDEDFDIVAGMTTDRKGFFVDGLKLLAQHDPKSAVLARFMFRGELKDVKVTGDTAAGTWTPTGERTDKALFKNTDGGWRVDEK